MKKLNQRRRNDIGKLLAMVVIWASFLSSGIAADNPFVEWRDGIYEGVDAKIKVSVTIESGKIKNIEIPEQGRPGKYFEKVKLLIPQMLEKQSCEVDGVTGATVTSQSLKNAVANALAKAQRPPEEKNVFSFTVKTIDGAQQMLSDYQGKVLLIVNTASKCGYTPQYRSLQALYEKYREKGFVVLGFPANNFQNQDPGNDAEIKYFCYLNYKTTFPLFSKISVVGNDIHPLYLYLTTQSAFAGPVTWNFNKFLIDQKGDVVARFDSPIDPLSPEVITAIEKTLSQQ